MSNVINSSVLVMNAGTAKSGWWNPDHAARMAAGNSAYAGKIKGHNVQYISAINSNVALAVANAKAFGGAGNNDYDEEDVDAMLEGSSKTTKGIIAEAKKSKDLTAGQLNTERLEEPYGVEDVIAEAVTDVNRLAGDIAPFAVGERKITPNDQVNLQRKIREINAHYLKDKEIAPAFRDTDYVFDGKKVPLSKIVETNLNDLSDYVKSI